MSLSLEQLFVSEDETNKQYPALDPHWKSDVHFITYQPPPLCTSDVGALEEWMERMRFIESDLHQLLEFSHHRFWCQVIFDEGLHLCLDSFLRYAPRSSDKIYHLSSECLDLQKSVHRLVFMVYVRMATHKESREHHITPSVFGDILYENFLFDVPKLMDLCVLYGSGNAALLSKMINNVFTQQPKYIEDLRATIPTITQVLNAVIMKLGEKVDSEPNSPQKLSKPLPEAVAEAMTVTQLQDLVFYLGDTAATLWSFLEVYPAACKIYHEEGFLARLIDFYEKAIPAIKHLLKERSKSVPNEVIRQLKSTVAMAATRFVRAVRQIISVVHLQPLFETQDLQLIEQCVEGYMETMIVLLADKRFLYDYQRLYPFEEDRDHLSQTKYVIDDTRLQFIDDAFKEAKRAKPAKRRKAMKKSPVVNGTDTEVEETLKHEVLEGACAPRVVGIELDSLITSVKDLLPELGDGFIELCLEEYNYDCEQVINAVLEDRLPPSLESVNRTLPRELPAVEEQSLLSERRNVFDNDEFDVFSRNDVDFDKIHFGKKGKTAEQTILDDKKELASLKPLFDKYGSEFVESVYDNVPEYEDEYDDTYDSNLIGATDADSADELTVRRPFTIPRVLGGASHATAEDKGENEESEDDEEDKSKRDEFIQDPAKIREQQAQRWASRQAARGRAPQKAPSHDVKGKPKGQGQDTQTVRNRAWKEKHKATGAHHNRKAMADRKRVKGMGPL